MLNLDKKINQECKEIRDRGSKLKIYEGWINYRFTIVHKSILVITQSCTEDSK